MISFEKMKRESGEREAFLIGVGREFAVLDGREGEISRISVRKEEKIRKAYGALKEWLEKKNYFVVTENTDDVIYEAGFSHKRIVAPCGSFFRLQCRCADEQHLWPVSERRMASREEVCETCNAVKLPNVYHLNQFNRQQERYDYNENGYIGQWNLYNSWLMSCMRKKLLILELGVGFETPNLIRWPFERIAFMGSTTRLVRVNQTLFQVDEKIRERAESIAKNGVDFVLDQT